MTTRDARFSHLLFSNIFQLFTSRTLLCSFSKSSLQYLLVLIVFISTYRLSTSGSNICSAVGVFFSMISLYLHPQILLFFFSTPYFFSTFISSITLLPLIRLCVSRLHRADSLQKLRKLQIQIRKSLSSTLQVAFLIILTTCLFASMSSYIPFVRSPCTWPQVIIITDLFVQFVFHLRPSPDHYY